MEETKTKKITASEARKIADSTNSFVNRVYKVIREASKEGEISITYDCSCTSKVLLEEAIKDLQENGFKVEAINMMNPYDSTLDHTYEFLKIRW